MMTKGTGHYVCIEPDLKEQAERVLSQLGIPLSTAVDIFLNQVVARRGLPFDVKLPPANLLCINSLTESELDAELEKGYSDFENGDMTPITEAGILKNNSSK